MDFLTTVCFTGHRPPRIGGYDRKNPLRLALSRELRRAVATALERGYRTFISGMAQGVDQDAAEAVLEFKGVYPKDGIQLVAAVPFLGQEVKWPYAARQHYFRLLEKADEVVYVNEPGYAGWKMNARNIWMVDRSSLVIAVFDGTAGGTKNCLDYAWGQDQPQRQFIIINPELVLRPEYVPEGI